MISERSQRFNYSYYRDFQTEAAAASHGEGQCYWLSQSERILSMNVYQGRLVMFSSLMYFFKIYLPGGTAPSLQITR